MNSSFNKPGNHRQIIAMRTLCHDMTREDYPLKDLHEAEARLSRMCRDLPPNVDGVMRKSLLAFVQVMTRSIAADRELLETQLAGHQNDIHIALRDDLYLSCYRINQILDRINRVLNSSVTISSCSTINSSSRMPEGSVLEP